MNIEAYKADIKFFELIRYPKTNATGPQPAQQYDSVLHTLITLHAPLVTRKISLKPPNHGGLLTSWLLKDIVDIWSMSGVKIRPH